MLISFSTQAQNLFVADSLSYQVYQFTPDGVQSDFTFVPYGPRGLAFDSAGNLFVAAPGSGSIDEFTPGGAQSTFASGLNEPVGLAFNSAGNLFVADYISGNIYEFTPGGVRSTFASGLNCACLVWPLTARAICLWRITAAATSMNSRRAECKAPLPPGWLA